MNKFARILAIAIALLIITPYIVAAWMESPVDVAFRSQAPGQFVTLTNGETHYRWLGEETGEIVVLVHGLSVPNYIFAQTAAALAGAGYRVLLFDQFGHGFSDRPTARYDADFFDLQMIELFDQLELTEPVIIGALSMGGIVAVEFTTRHAGRVKSLMLFAPAGLRLVNESDSSFVKMLKLPFLGHWMWRIVGHQYYAQARSHEKTNAEIQSGESMQGDPALQANHQGYLMAIRQIFRFFPLHHRDDLFAKIGQLQVPVLGIFGDNDSTINLASAELLADLIPDARIEVLAGGTHHLNIHRWRDVHEIVLSFLRRNNAGVETDLDSDLD